MGQSKSRVIAESGGTAVPFMQDTSPVLTPMMAQYAEIKAQHPDCLLFYRMGDFFELFFEDAEKAAAALNIQLTKRGKHLGQDIPMCGVPVVRAEDYLEKLIAQGFKVAVCEQLEDPAQAKARGGKSVVKRGIVRLVTPGTITEDSLLDGRSNSFLTAVHATRDGNYAIASVDISTGEFLVSTTASNGLSGELARLAPREILTGDGQPLPEALKSETRVPQAYFNAASGEIALKKAYATAHLDAFVPLTRAEMAACCAVLRYIEITQIGKLPPLRPPKRSCAATAMSIDAATRTSLELMQATGGGAAGSLVAAIDRTVTGAGARLLKQWVSAPLLDPAAVHARLDAVAYLHGRAELRDSIRRGLKNTPDIARSVSRLKLGRGGPRDLGIMRAGLQAADELSGLLGRDQQSVPSSSDGFAEPGAALIAAALADLDAVDPALLRDLNAALNDELPILIRDGGLVREGFSAGLDGARRLARDGRDVIAAMQFRYVNETGIRSLKIKHNNVLGYFIEVPAGAAKPLMSAPFDAEFRHRQTMSNCMRFTTAELADIEARMSIAGDTALDIEAEIFETLTAAILAQERALGAVSEALAVLDVFAALAWLAEEQGYVRPVVDDSSAFDIREGRHPVVEQALKREHGPAFIGNDCDLGGDGGGRLLIVTGPNMAGKSTFLRQNALIAILAQAGSFVPAAYAHIGVVDKLFSRVGAADDLARGRSTFMVEMVETAAILNQATARSLVILDEIGRGTATFDGLSIAWGCLEYLHDTNQCRALFATHYHELTALAVSLPRASNVTMAVKEWKDEIVFLHQVRKGAADRSYGIQVAKLAGLPRRVVERARAVLAMLEDGKGNKGAEVDALPLFAAAQAPQLTPAEPTPIEQAVAELHPDAMSPREALDTLYRLKRLLAGDADARPVSTGVQ